MSDEPLRVTVGSDGRVEVAGCGLVLALGPDDGQVSVLVFGGDVLLGHLRLARDGVEIAQAGQLRGTLVEWPR